MARLLTTGFELGEIIEHNGSTSIGSGGAMAVVTSPVRTGTYACRFQGGAINKYAYFWQVLSNPQELYARIAFRHEISSGTDKGTILHFLEQANSHVQIQIRSTDLKLELIVLGASQDVGDIVLAANTWYVIEAYVKISNTVGAVTVKVNGVTDLSYSGDTCAGSNEYTDIVRLGIDGIGLVYFYLDDVAVNDVSGTQQNSWIGQGGVYLLLPNGDGASAQWSLSAGADHYALVDEVPKNTTDYIYSTTVSQLDLFTLTDLPAEVSAVSLIEPLFQAALAEAGSNDVKHVVRHGGVNYDGDTETIVNVHPTYALVKSAPIYEVLGGAGLWTPAQVNALESGVEVV